LEARAQYRCRFSGSAENIVSYGCNYAEAMRLARAAIRQRGDFVGGHRVLTAAAGMAGKTDIAAAALQELRRAQPNISLAWIESEMPIGNDVERAHYVEAFRRGGGASNRRALSTGRAPSRYSRASRRRHETTHAEFRRPL
jgi:hypothetical protein